MAFGPEEENKEGGVWRTEVIGVVEPGKRAEFITVVQMGTVLESASGKSLPVRVLSTRIALRRMESDSLCIERQ